MVAAQREAYCATGKGMVGNIFLLKSCHGYKDVISFEDTTERPEETDEERSAMIEEIAEKVRREMLEGASKK